MELTPINAMKRTIESVMPMSKIFIVDDIGISNVLIGVSENEKDENFIMFITTVNQSFNAQIDKIEELIKQASAMSLDGKYHIAQQDGTLVCYFIQPLKINGIRKKELTLGKILYSGVSSLKSVLYDINALQS